MFAIAITLLVIEIGVPHLKGEPDGTTLLGDHHTRFRFIERSNHILLFLNTLFLMCVAFIPFPTALLAEY